MGDTEIESPPPSNTKIGTAVTPPEGYIRQAGQGSQRRVGNEKVTKQGRGTEVERGGHEVVRAEQDLRREEGVALAGGVRRGDEETVNVDAVDATGGGRVAGTVTVPGTCEQRGDGQQ